MANKEAFLRRHARYRLGTASFATIKRGVAYVTDLTADEPYCSPQLQPSSKHKAMQLSSQRKSMQHSSQLLAAQGNTAGDQRRPNSDGITDAHHRRVRARTTRAI